MRSFDKPALLRTLRSAGWMPEGASTVLGATLHPQNGIEPGVELLEGTPSAEWRRDHARVSGANPA